MNSEASEEMEGREGSERRRSARKAAEDTAVVTAVVVSAKVLREVGYNAVQIRLIAALMRRPEEQYAKRGQLQCLQTFVVSRAISF